ncbi:MAG TPA: excisionase family DNA-binding protein [Sporichthyaceae bacterium]|jgi:excisionase family DNA binding protein|nr:excisionase family DNA-binding protein [Sporichthyaceae bacterium]
MTTVLLTVDDAAHALAIGRTKIYELLDAGTLRSIKIGRARRIPIDAVHEFVRSIETAASA